MKNGINSRVMKAKNTLLVLEVILRQAPISRSDLVQLVGLTQVSVINVTNALMEAGILVAVGNANGGGYGRKSVILDVNENAFYSVGVELSVGKLVCALCNAKGKVLRFVETEFSPYSKAELFVERVAEIVEGFLTEFQIDKKMVVGMGVAAPGPLDVQQGILVNPPNFPELKNAPIKKMLERRLELQVCIDKETNLAALAESFYGVSAGYHTSFFLSLFRLGVGGGLISKENIFHGFKDGAGEVGHLTVDTEGRKCSCGNYGCLEAVLAEDYVLECVRRMYKLGVETERPENLGDITLEEVFEQSEKGNMICEIAVKKMAAYIAIAIGTIVNMFSPEVIVLGGELPEMNEAFVKMIVERVQSRPYPAHCKNVKIEKSALGSMVYVRGAMALAQKTFLADVLPENYIEG